MFGVKANLDDTAKQWVIDVEATSKRREKIKIERKEKSLSFDDFWEYERKKITEGRLSEAVKRMYLESIALSKRWGKEFKEFWHFPDDFQMEVE